MDTRFIIFVAIVFGIVLVLKVLEELKPTKEKPKAFQKMLYKQRPFLTQSELVLFRDLENKYGDSYHIIPQVLISSIVDVDMPSRFYAYKGYRSKIDKKTLDFVLFDKATFAPVFAIELDDYTHERADRKLRDEFVNAVLEKVGIRIERVKSGQPHKVSV